MTICERGEVVLVKFVFSEGKRTKLRPALVLSTQDYHNHRQEIIMAAITSNVDRQLFGDTKLGDWKKAGLLYPSLAMAIIRTIKREMVERKLGRLSNKDFQSVKKNLKKVLGLNS
ncbi:unnamed protein product [marine sediment metagenome]|uniref:Type II toxin-antitoxin system PemK/MazF family toxin n=1 Tax=marine sediment metagenome TaxID=412755 RepID=X1IJ56_9ZZZZ